MALTNEQLTEALEGILEKIPLLNTILENLQNACQELDGRSERQAEATGILQGECQRFDKQLQEARVRIGRLEFELNDRKLFRS
jgi:chromosome segregation ATPase